jgi:hypothetical protein
LRHETIPQPYFISHLAVAKPAVTTASADSRSRSGIPVVIQRSAAEFTRANLSEADRTSLKNALAVYVCRDDQPLSAMEKPGVKQLMQALLNIQHKLVQNYESKTIF